MWSRILVCFFMVLSTNAFSKYGRTCKDIGCLNSEVCVIAEDPCSYGRQSDCGTYPTCKKKTAADSGGDNQNIPVAKPTIPKPKPPPSRYDDDIPNYPPPAPPRGSSYGSNTGGGSSYGGGSPYGGGSQYGGGTPYGGGSTNGGGSTSGGSSGGLFGPGGLFGNAGSLFGNNGGSLFGNNAGSRPSSGTSDGNPFSQFGFGSNSGGGSSSGSNGGNPLTNILSNILGNITKGGSLLPSMNTRPIVQNPSYPYNNPSNPYGQPGNPANDPYNRPSGYYPSYNQPPNNGGQQPSLQSGYVAKNYQASHSGKSSATTTRKPISYGWNFGAGIICLLLTRTILVNNVL